LSARPIYLDHHATTPVDPRVLEAMQPWWSEDFGNPSSASHLYGWRAEAAVEDARERLAAAIGASEPSEIVFTSGTTESDNLALKGVARAGRARGDQLLASAIEHPAVLDAGRALEREGFSLGLLPVDGDGLVAADALERALTDKTLLASVMAANGEIGVLQPLPELARVCRERGVPLHTDAAQALGKVPVDVDAWGVDLLSACAHKLYGPKGIGLLYVRRRRPRLALEPLLHGGGHERGLRSGTLPVPLIVGFARAVELCLEEMERESQRLAALRDELFARLRDGLGDVRRNGHAQRRLPGNLNVTFDGVQADGLIASLPDLAVSSGSACSSRSAEPSHVLRAIGLTDAQARASLRFGLGRGTTQDDVQRAAGRLVESVRQARSDRPAAAVLGRLSSQ
jgi:cysteine desulfurase